MRRGWKGEQAGYALIIVLLMVALVAIALTAALPRPVTQGQREREEELIFRGEQYRRAIGLFNWKFGRLPLSLDELLYTSQLGFLRRPWPDPMSAEGEWRVIRVGPTGELIGSVTGGAGVNLQALSGGQPQGSATRRQEAASTRSSASSSTSGTNPYPIIGVASTSTARSIRVYNNFQHYNEWEFIYDPVQDALRSAAGGAAQPGAAPSGQPGKTGKPSPQPGTPPRRRR